MKCPRCGNEVSQDEVFCGQCGAPNTPPAQPANRVNSPPPATRGGQGNLYGTNTSYPPQHNSPPQTPPAGQYQPTGFYQDATEAMILPPGGISQSQPTIYPSQQPGTQAGYAHQGQYIAPQQASQPGHYRVPPYPQQTFATGHEYPNYASPKPRGGAVAIMVSICLIVVLISAVGLAAIFLTRNHTAPTVVSPTSIATTAPVPTPTPAPTPSPTAMPSPTPTPTVVATVTTDSGFALCDTACTNNGFITEYPAAWQTRTLSKTNGVQFTSPDQPDQLAAFKATGPTTDSAGNIALADLQKTFSKKTSFQSDLTTNTTTISGETWATVTAYYQIDTQSGPQRERVIVYATVHQNQAYVIELQAADADFDSVNAQVFTPMLGKFQFQQNAST